MTEADKILANRQGGRLKRSHQLTRLVWSMAWWPVKTFLPRTFGGGIKD